MKLSITLMMTLSAINIMGTPDIANAQSASSGQRVNGSDVVKYGLSAHGISYLLRDKPASVNAWRTSEINRSSRWGNTDCSGLAAASIRYRGYVAPEARRKPGVTTAAIGDYAARNREGFFFPTTQFARFKETVRHGDMFNYTQYPRGHVFLYNGENSTGNVETVEAKCTRCGVGAFTKSWNDIAKANFKLVRHQNIVQDIQDKRRNFRVSDADASNRIANGQNSRREQVGPEIVVSAPRVTRVNNTNMSSSVYIVKRGDSGMMIARDNGISWRSFERANPNVVWNRLRIGQRLNIPR